MRLRIGLALVIVASVGIEAPPAAALPDLHVLEGDTFPVTAQAENPKVATNLSTAVSKLDGTGFKATITCNELSALCPYDATFKGVKEGKLSCKSGSEPAETIKVSGNEGHLVYITLTPLTLGMLFLVKSLEMLCGSTENPDKVKIKVEGQLLSAMNGVTSGADTESFKSALKGEKGKQELKKYFSDEGKEVSAVSLKANFGLGFENADENIAEELTFFVTKMVAFLF